MSSNARALAGYAFLVVFANDDELSEEELKMLERIALEDGVVDAEEAQALKNIFARAEKHRLAPEVKDEIEDFRARFGI